MGYGRRQSLFTGLLSQGKITKVRVSLNPTAKQLPLTAILSPEPDTRHQISLLTGVQKSHPPLNPVMEDGKIRPPSQTVIQTP